MAKLLPFVASTSQHRRWQVSESRIVKFVTREMRFAQRWCEFRRWLHERQLAENRAARRHEQQTPE